MGTITYRLKEGALPITVSLQGSTLPDNTHEAYGEYSFTEVPYGEYSLRFVDCNGCVKTISLVYCNSCPEGWSSTIEGCYLEETAVPTPPTNPQNIEAKSNLSYCNFGVAFFGEGWNYNGTGDTYTLYHETATNFWGNYTASTTLGAANRCGVWSQITVSNQMVGFSACVNILSEKTYYIGFSCDNYGEIRIDGQSILYQDPNALNAWSTAGDQGDMICFKYFYIYPVSLSAGKHVMEVIGHNFGSVAMIAVEIYDMTEADLMACTSYEQMGSHLIFSSKDKVGDPVDIGDNGQGYTCPEGYSLGMCGESPSCYRYSFLSCGQSLITTSSSTTTTTTTEGPLYYISPSGNDSNNGSYDSPWATMAHAADSVTPGSTILLKNGTYTASGGDTDYFAFISSSGTENNYITFRAETPLAAVIDGQNTLGYGIGLLYGASYLRFEGIEMKNFLKLGFDINHSGYSSSYIEIEDNLIHDIGRVVDDSDYGRCAIYVGAGSHHLTVQRNYAYNIGRTSSVLRFNRDHFFYSRTASEGEETFLGHDNTIAYNVVYSVSGNTLNLGSYNDKVYNNVFAYPSENPNPTNPGGGIYIIVEGIGGTGLQIINNIFYEFSDQAFALYRLGNSSAESYSGWQVKNNMVYGGRMWEPSTYNASWQQPLMSDNYGQIDCQHAETDPLFTSPSLSSPDFTLQGLSPAINAGYNLSLTEDHLKNAVINPPDIGAYEHA